jgi:type IV pilus assembly protein PilW
MVALAISTFLILGVVQVFTASKSAYLASEGLARVQESARFALDFLQRDTRMAGHFGCKGDLGLFHPKLNPAGRNVFTTLALTGNQLNAGINAYPNAPDQFRFDTGVEGHEFAGTARGSTYNLSSLGENPPAVSGLGSWAPAIGAGSALATALAAGDAIAGNDILVLRFFSSESVPIRNVGASSNVVRVLNVSGIGGVDALDLYGVANCRDVAMFQASAAWAGGQIPVNVAGLNLEPLSNLATFGAEARLYRAESVAYFVGVGVSGRPTLKRVRFNDLSGGAPPIEELVEGVENMQLEYGYDTTPTADPPDTSPDAFAVASDGNLGGAATAALRAENWRRVRTVRIALLVRSDDRAVSPAPGTILANGVILTPFDDARVRSVYQSTVTLRNRLVGTGA